MLVIPVYINLEPPRKHIAGGSKQGPTDLLLSHTWNSILASNNQMVWTGRIALDHREGCMPWMIFERRQKRCSLTDNSKAALRLFGGSWVFRKSRAKDSRSQRSPKRWLSLPIVFPVLRRADRLGISIYFWVRDFNDLASRIPLWLQYSIRSKNQWRIS